MVLDDNVSPRRSFLIRGFTFLAGLWAGFRLRADPPKLRFEPPEMLTPFVDDATMTADVEEIVREVEAAFPYLKLDPAGVRAYAREVVKFRDSGDLKTAFFMDLRQRFLLSSDFFDQGEDESRTVSYVSLYDPYVNPCTNRMARVPPEG